MKIVSFGHRKRVGKDTCSKFLDSFLRVERPGLIIKKVSFASKLKDVSYQLFGWAGLRPGIFYESEAGAKIKEEILPKIGKSPRQIWIEVGNKMREIYSEVWIEHALEHPTADCIIISDLRFINEAQKILSLDGFLYRIDRPGQEQGNDPAEVSLESWKEWTGIIKNDGTLSDLHKKIEVIGRGLIE
jgi:hypothetical protein